MGNGFSTTPVSRITLFCRDLDQSLELYRDILGFKEIENKTIQSKEFNELMNIEDENCRENQLSTIARIRSWSHCFI